MFASNREAEPDASYKTDLWIVSTGEGDAAKLTRLTNDDSVKSLPRWSPDGRSIAYLSAVDGVYGIQQARGDPRVGRHATDAGAGARSLGR